MAFVKEKVNDINCFCTKIIPIFSSHNSQLPFFDSALFNSLFSLFSSQREVTIFSHKS